MSREVRRSKIINGVQAKRTVLYALTPVGVGTAQVESLTSFKCRLAEDHHLSVEGLQSGIIFPWLEGSLEDPILGGTARCHLNNGYFSSMNAYNGWGSGAQKMVKAIGALTGRSGLDKLTLLPLPRIFCSKGLLRRTRAWCPECLKAMREGNLTAYEKLIWNFGVVNICGEHDIPLLTRCPDPRCGRSQPVLDRHTYVSRCSKCGAWLDSAPSEETPDVDVEWERSVVKDIERLIVEGPAIRPFPNRETLITFIRVCINTAAEGNVAAFARLLSLPKHTAWCWYEGHGLPTLENLLRVCRLVGIPLVDSLRDSTWDRIPGPSRIRSVPNRSRTKRRKPVLSDLAIVEADLKKMRARNKGRLSVLAISRLLGLSYRLLYRNFPIICRQISAEHRAWRSRQAEARRSDLSSQVAKTTEFMIQSGDSPTRKRLEELMHRPALLRERCIREQWRNALRRLTTGGLNHADTEKRVQNDGEYTN